MPESTTLEHDLHAAARFFRLGMEARASELLARAIDALLSGAIEPCAIEHAARVLEELVAAQEHGDTIGLADRLQYELIPILNGPSLPVGEGPGAPLPAFEAEVPLTSDSTPPSPRAEGGSRA